jgi:PA domain
MADYPDAGDACNLADISPAVNGSIALTRRGGCYFSTKAANVLAAGAVGGRPKFRK